MRTNKSSFAILIVLAVVSMGYPSAFEPEPAARRQIKWARKTIPIAISSSLTLPNASVRANSDVTGALHRALAAWSTAADVTFVEVSSNLQSISQGDRGDGINLITVAATNENLDMFADTNIPARTRVFFDVTTGEISEADVVLNPYAYAPDGTPLEFSTDGTPGTYDLQSTLTHEIGHVLGLNHSHVISATMNPSQAPNGTYGLPAFSQRTLSESDRAAVINVYGARNKTGVIEGRLLTSQPGNLLPVAGAHIWIEDMITGRVMASGLTSANGGFRLEGIPPASYRVMAAYLEADEGDQFLTLESGRRSPLRSFRTVEIAGNLRVSANRTTPLSYILVPPLNSPPTMTIDFVGAQGELSTAPLAASAGTRVTIYLSGPGVDQVPGTGLATQSPYLIVDPASLTAQPFHATNPVISFDIRIAADAPAGDYSIRLQSNSGEIAYAVGAITIEPR